MTSSDMELKQFTVDPVTDEGTFRAVFATLGVVDRDGDVILPSAIEAGKVVPVAQWGHNHGALPIGEAELEVVGNEAIAAGRLFLDTAAGADHYKVLKARGIRQEWSFGFYVLQASDGLMNGQQVRVIEKAEIIEVSPVMVGAGIGTRTDDIKGLRFGEQSEATLASVSALIERTKALAALRAKEGRVLSAANREMLAGVADALREAVQRIEELLAATARDEALSPELRAMVMAAMAKYLEVRDALKR